MYRYYQVKENKPSDLIQQAVVKDEFLEEEIISHKDKEFIYNPEDGTHYPTYETEDVTH
ncbi:hypothetical protein BWQ96_08617 [Gracilariopsis chorda]|uniref:Uncharacterized protein n=1 Tax=Gracilariopsis chorda TaxID=448386 RepID=A0A2V3IHU6_9FLOR|nr:hypothetical protein BWQ96_08617 [Gracilariopsis chorda]|eukprot:PXF41666.1 hypothetical protein BWQ96_08617 [Gracilariopsis chorda]